MTITGTHGPHFKGERIEMVRGKFRRIQRWEGTEAECKGLLPGLRNAADYASCDRIGDTPVWFTEAVFEGASSNDPNIVDTFELLFNTEQLPHLASDRLTALLSESLKTKRVKVVQGLFNKIENAAVDQTTGEAEFDYDDAVAVINSRHGSAAATMIRLLDLMILGVSSFFYDSPVLRWTRSYNWRVTQQPNMVNVNKVYATSAALIGGEDLALPSSLVLPEKQWFKKAPQMRLQYEGQGEIIYEYWGADVWESILYADAA